MVFSVCCFRNSTALGTFLLSGAFTLVIMILPLIMRTAEEALKSVLILIVKPASDLEQVNFVPSSPLFCHQQYLVFWQVWSQHRTCDRWDSSPDLYSRHEVAEVPKNLMGSGRTLALHMYVLSGEGLHMNQASATAVVILAFVLFVINFLSGAVTRNELRKDKEKWVEMKK